MRNLIFYKRVFFVCSPPTPRRDCLSHFSLRGSTCRPSWDPTRGLKRLAKTRRAAFRRTGEHTSSGLGAAAMIWAYEPLFRRCRWSHTRHASCGSTRDVPGLSAGRGVKSAQGKPAFAAGTCEPTRHLVGGPAAVQAIPPSPSKGDPDRTLGYDVPMEIGGPRPGPFVSITTQLCRCPPGGEDSR